MATNQLRQVGKTKLFYDTKKQIGRGTLGSSVFQGFFGDDKEIVAVKRILKSDVKDDEPDIKRETEIMLKAENHANILRYSCTESNKDFWYHALFYNHNYIFLLFSPRYVN